MEGLKQAIRQMMAQGTVPQFDGNINSEVLRQVVQSAQGRMPAELGGDI